VSLLDSGRSEGCGRPFEWTRRHARGGFRDAEECCFERPSTINTACVFDLFFLVVKVVVER
jgi:hypothetical protein